MVALLPKITSATCCPVVAIREPTFDQLHDSAELQSCGKGDNHMEMIRHDYERKEIEFGLRAHFVYDFH